MQKFYSVANIPIYLSTKTLIDLSSQSSLTIDFGMGPNIIKTSDYSESPLDSMTLPDNAFSGQSHVAFSATAGIGFRFNNVLRRLPIEIGYRFFYLNQGYLGKKNDQILSNLNTSNSYTNALIISTSI